MEIIAYAVAMADEPKKNPILATGKTVAANVKRLREEKRLKFTDLAARVDQLGKPIPTLGLRHIEAEKRRVDVDELAAIAVALGVSPITLMMPVVNDPASEVETTGSDKVAAGRLWDWLLGVYPLTYRRDRDGLVAHVFQSKARPGWVPLTPSGSVVRLPEGVDMEVVNKIAQNAAAEAVQELLAEPEASDGDD